MRFILRMTYRELRSSWQRLAFFFICVAVGVAAIVALRSLIQNVRVALAAEARTLLAGDISIRSDRPWSDEAQRIIEGRLADVAPLRRTDPARRQTWCPARLPPVRRTRSGRA